MVPIITDNLEWKKNQKELAAILLFLNYKIIGNIITDDALRSLSLSQCI